MTHAWYAHLTSVEREVRQMSADKPHVAAGDKLGQSGRARSAWHLHLGLLLDDDTAQDWGGYLLEDEVRRVLCGLRARARLPTS